MQISWILTAVIIVIVVYVIAAYNSIVTLRNRVKEAWADIDVQLKRRHDLIPNLVEVVKGYATHEKDIFENVAEARTRAMGAQSGQDKAEAENALSQTLKSLFAVAEAYPELKASTNFLELQRELTDAEDKIQAARRFYNANVRDFNTKIQVFPTNIFAQIFGFTLEQLFEIADASEREVPQVKF